MRKFKKFSLVLVVLLVLASMPMLFAEEYTVVQGDVLWKIAKKYDTTWEKLAEINELKNPNLIFPGQKIMIKKEEKAEVVVKPEEKSKNLVILHTNDMHGFFKWGKYNGMGAAFLAAKINEVRENNENVLLLDGGDALQGDNLVTLSKGATGTEIMNLFNYDAMVAGNHEFDYGHERLKELEGLLNFPVLSSNVTNAEGKLLLPSHIIKDVNGIKVGIFGLSTPETTYKTHPDNVNGLVFEDPKTAAKRMVDELKGKVDIIIAVGHLGDEGDYSSMSVCEAVDGIDVFVDGHSHHVYDPAKRVNGTLIVQAGEKTKNLGIVNLTLKDNKIVDSTSRMFNKKEAKATVSEDPEMKALVDRIVAENKKIEDEVVATSPIKLEGEREIVRIGESNLGNIITEAFIYYSKADVALTNGGGIRASINKGDVTKGEVLTVLPFGNTVRVIKLKGSDIKLALENGVKMLPERSGGFPHIAGMTVEFDSSKPAGERVQKVLIKGEALDPDKDYTLVTNDFLVAGGDEYEMFKGKEVVGELGTMDQLVIDYFNEVGFDKAKVDGRLKDLNK